MPNCQTKTDPGNLDFVLYFYGQIVFALYKDLWDNVTNKIQ